MRTRAWTNSLRRCAETQSPYFIAMLINGTSKRRQFTDLGWNGVLEVARSGEVYGAGHKWQHPYGYVAPVQPYIPSKSRALVVSP